MRVLINNFDGLGLIDYTAYVQFGDRALIRRKLNAPTICEIPVVLDGRLPMPGQSARLVIQAKSEAYLFTGYLKASPDTTCIGSTMGTTAQERLLVAASDEAQLDTQAWETGTTLLGGTAAQNWATLSMAAAKNGLQVTLSDGLQSASRVTLTGGSTWSELAGRLAAITRSSYCVLNGNVTVSPLNAVTHSLPQCGSALSLSGLTAQDSRLPATDVTVFGRLEPDAYVTEIFQADGITSEFSLTSTPFHPSSSQTSQLADHFQGTAINSQLWTTNDAGGHIGLTAQGLTCAGGSGRDGESTICSVQTFELGGNFLVEAKGVQVQDGSVGILAGLFTGKLNLSSCFVGFAVTTIHHQPMITAIINGATTGAAFSASANGLYTLRLRVDVLAVERVRQTYVYKSDSGTAAAGGDLVPSSGRVTIEIQDTSNGALGATTILYSGSLSSIPAACQLAPLVSGSLVCGVQSIACTQTAPVQISAGLPGAAPTPLILGALADGGACQFETSGSIRFYPSSLPSAGVQLSVRYRSAKRAAARRISQSSTSPGRAVSSWAGVVSNPPAWSSADCENAAIALLGYTNSGSFAMQSSYQMTCAFSDDFWPGDALALSHASGEAALTSTMSAVRLALLNAESEILQYLATLTNSEHELLGIQTSADIGEESSFPLQATALDRALNPLTNLVIKQATSTILTIDTGTDAPVNGGFEVRRRDDTFGASVDSDLVLRTAARTFSIPRVFPVEQFFIRMYDGQDPANYSLQSAAIYINVLS